MLYRRAQQHYIWMVFAEYTNCANHWIVFPTISGISQQDIMQAKEVYRVESSLANTMSVGWCMIVNIIIIIIIVTFWLTTLWSFCIRMKFRFKTIYEDELAMYIVCCMVWPLNCVCVFRYRFNSDTQTMSFSLNFLNKSSRVLFVCWSFL